MELLELILFLLIAVVASSLLDQVLRGVSLPLVQILLGVIIALVLPLSGDLSIDAELLLILFIAPLHFNESRHVDSGELYRNRFGIASLVTGLVLLTMVAVGGALHALMPAIPLAAALAFGAAMGSTDAAAVTSLAKDMKFGRRHEALLNGEALFNDVTGTVGFQCAIAVVVSGSFSLAHAGEEFAIELFGGMLLGAVLGVAFWGVVSLLRRFGLENPTVHVVIELLAPFIVYLVCEQIHAAGVIGVVAAGMTISLLPHKRTASTAKQRLQASGVWKTLEFVLNGVIFVVLGMQLPHVLQPALETSSVDAGLLIAAVIALTAVLEVVRFAWILGLDLMEARRRGRPLRVCFSRRNLKGTLGMAFAGPKGGVTLALMLTMPLTVASGEAFPLRTELLFLTSGVILCTMLLANFAVRKLVPHKPHEKRTKAYADAEINLLMRVIASIQADAHFTGAVTRGAAADAAPAGSGAGAASGELRASAEAAAADAASVAPAATGAAQAQETPAPASATQAQTVEDAAAPLLPEEVDEPATAIVMHRYADRMRDLLPHASAEVAAQARAVVARCDELYEQADAVAEALDAIDDADEEEAGLPAHVLALKLVGEAVDDIQDQALARELEYIKAAHRAGELSAEHARDLRNDVYVQKLVAN